jgi:hypothetical protein
LYRRAALRAQRRSFLKLWAVLSAGIAGGVKKPGTERASISPQCRHAFVFSSVLKMFRSQNGRDGGVFSSNFARKAI